jgi:penicillin-binding protein 2
MRLAELKDHERELRRFHLRVVIAGIAVFLAFGLLLARMFYLQVVQHDYYQTKAEDNRITIVPIAPPRGLILDRSGTVLARNESGYTLEISPSRVKDLAGTIDQLSKIVEIGPRDIARFKKLLAESRNADSLPIRTRLSDEEVARFAVSRFRFPGVEIRARLFRSYPLGESASHVIGYIGRINEADQDRLEELGVAANYRGTDTIGKRGIEASYEQDLHGTTGFEQMEIDAAGRSVRALSRTPPQPGNDVSLTLDVGLQQVAERAFGDRRGALVAIEPRTGAVLALVSEPGYDPNLFVDGIDPQSWDALNNSPDHPLNNRAIAGLYPPGSTLKPYLALAALELGKRTPKSTIHDPGYFIFGDRRFRDDKPGGHGVVDLYRSLVVSCDTYYYMLANDLGIDTIARSLAPFGFGSRTGIDIDGEAEGVLPSPQWKARRFTRLQRLHADSARRGRGDPRQRRRHVPATPRRSHRRSAHRGAPLHRAATREASAAAGGESAVHPARHGGRHERQGGHGLPGIRRRAIYERGEDRHGAGDCNQGEREVRREERLREAS